MNGASACPCDVFVHPQTITNTPGLDLIRYRIGDFAAFRKALLLARAGEIELVGWRPGAQEDLAVQMIEWWAYIADILTFYNERIANNDYLRTADQAANVQRLVRLLGYRPRPGIGATATLAALMNKPLPFTIPQGFQIQSKPGPGQQPQIFEVGANTTISPPDAIASIPAPSSALITTDNLGRASVLLQGVIGSVKAHDSLVLMEKNWNADDANYALVTVAAVTPEKDPSGNSNTRIAFVESPALTGDPADFNLLKSQQSAHVWQYPANNVIREEYAHLGSIASSAGTGQIRLARLSSISVLRPIGSQVDLESITRTIKVGDPLLFQIPGGEYPAPVMTSVTAYTEVIWYAYPPSAGSPDPTKPPPAPAVQIPIPHTSITIAPAPDASHPVNEFDTSRPSVLVQFNYQAVGVLIGTPATTFDGSTPTLDAVAPAVFPQMLGQPVLIEDANGNGAQALATTHTPSSQMTRMQLIQARTRSLALFRGLGGVSGALIGGGARISSSGASSPAITASALGLANLPDLSLAPLISPLRTLFNLLSVTRGKTVANEILGSGDATLAGQEFTLTNSPLTYLLDPNSASGDSYSSTLQVWVDGIEWKEVPSFYGQPATAHIFVTREDATNRTHVAFGDGVHGARLTSGVKNVVAKYRFGSGAQAPAAGSLTVVMKPIPNLKEIRNPVPASGGADPDPRDQIKRYAPKSVFTLGRAVSADDYEVIAAQAPGVARARAYWDFDPDEQRSMVIVYVGDNQGAVDAAAVALAGADDPNRPVSVKPATAVPMLLSLMLVVDPAYIAPDVATAVGAALLDPVTGLLGEAIGIGQIVYDSEIYAACISVPGVLAAHSLAFEIDLGNGFMVDATVRHNPGRGGFLQLLSSNLLISTETASNG